MGSLAKQLSGQSQVKAFAKGGKVASGTRPTGTKSAKKQVSECCGKGKK